MEQRNTPESFASQEDRRKNRRRLLPLFFFILILLAGTSSIVGYILGRSAGTEPLGQMIDSIVVSPEAGQEETAFHLSGRVARTDGTPAAGCRLELHSDPITAVTDSNGGFLFSNVLEGEHTIYVMNADGTAAAQRNLQVSRNQEADSVSIGLAESGAYTIELSIDVRILEIVIELDTGDLYIDPDKLTYARNDGTVVTPGGSVSIEDGVIVSPGGNVYLPDGTIVFPGGTSGDPTYIIQPDNTVLVDRAITAGEIDVASDGTVTLPGGTVIEPGGGIEGPGGAAGSPGETGLIIDAHTVTPIGDSKRPALPNETRPQGNGDGPSNTANSGTAETGGSTPAKEPEKPTAPQPEGLPDSKPAQTEDPAPDKQGGSGGGGNGSGGGTTLPPDDGTLQASAQKPNGEFAEWEQNSTIDLFYNRETGKVETIAPGSKGYYLFRLQNGRRERLNITLSIVEGESSPHIPLKFTLRQQDGKTGVSGVLTDGNALTLSTKLAGGGDAVYQLDWEWPFEGGRDGEDTLAASLGEPYTLKLMIRAEGGS